MSMNRHPEYRPVTKVTIATKARGLNTLLETPFRHMLQQPRIDKNIILSMTYGADGKAKPHLMSHPPGRPRTVQNWPRRGTRLALSSLQQSRAQRAEPDGITAKKP